jgi:quinol monooxygenase YgiN
MITEIAHITIDPANAAAFEAAVTEAASAFANTAGCHGLTLERVIEDPTRYLLRVQWDSVDAHMAFRETPEFQTWRGLAGPFFKSPPVVEHSETVARFF